MKENKLLSPVEKRMPMHIISFYLVGLALFFIPFTRSFFISVTSLTLLLAIGLVFFYHTGWNKKTILLFLFIIFSSFFFEMAGTRTGKIFGAYTYDQGLGIQWNHTPLIIGLNWLFLIYATHDIASRWFLKPVTRIITGAVLMLFYDLFLEWIAPFMQMWHFSYGYPPLDNFVAWFLASLIFHTGFEICRVHTNNSIARWLYWTQIVFFTCIGIYSSYFLK